VDGKSATLLLGSDVSGECKVYADDGQTRINFTAKVSAVTFGILSLLDGAYYWLGFDKDLGFLNAVPQSDYSEATRVDEEIYQLYMDYEIGPPLVATTAIKKNGTYFKGPYVQIDDGETVTGETCSAVLGPAYPYEGSVNGHSMFAYYVHNFDTSTRTFYLTKNDVDTVLVVGAADGDGTSGATVAYSDYCSLVTYGLNGYAHYVLRRMGADGEYKELDWTSFYSYDGTYRHITIDGVTYRVTTSLKRLKKA
jgi:hypothetical protein